MCMVTMEHNYPSLYIFDYILDLIGQGHLWVVDNTLNTLAAEGIINHLNNFLYIVVYNWLVIILIWCLLYLSLLIMLTCCLFQRCIIVITILNNLLKKKLNLQKSTNLEKTP